MAWIAARGVRATPLVRAELGADLPVDRWKEIPTSLDPSRPLDRLVRAGSEIRAALPRGTDLFVTDYHPVLDDVPTALTIHDLRHLVPGAAESRARTLLFSTTYPALARSAARVVTPTHAIAAACTDRLGTDPARTVVVPNALGAAWRTAPVTGTATPLHLLLVGAARRP